MDLKRFLISLPVLFICMSMCASKKPMLEREQRILGHYTEEKEKAYYEYLVDMNKYTTNGAFYQRKYIRLLIGLAGEVIEQKKLSIAKGTIGFYFDRKSPDDKKLYLGMDIDMGGVYADPYIDSVRNFFSKHLKMLLTTLFSCQSIFQEQEVIGLVIGFKWRTADSEDQVNIWIDENDMRRFEEGSLTFEELLHRSSITNTRGRIIRLPE